MPVLLVIAAAFCVSFYLQWSMNDGTLMIRALGERNLSAEGSEIWIQSIVIDGVEYEPEDVFSEGWISEGGYLKWRTYNQPFEVQNTISAVFSQGEDVDIRFDTNKWRGKVSVQWGHAFSYVIDCYSNNDQAGSSTISYSEEKTLSGLRLSDRTLFLYLFTALLILAAASILLCKRSEEPAKISSNRELWLDLLKVISAFLIVLIHTVGASYSSTPVESAKWFGYLVINTISRCGVPIFIMISGILLIGKETTMGKIFRTIKKALILLVVWNLVYIFAQSILWGSTESVLHQILSLPVKRGPSGHLWYSYLLVWIYLFAPVVSALYQALSNRMRVYFVAITIIVPGILDLYLKIFDINASETLHSTHLYMTLSYIGMMFIGRLLYENASSIKRMGLFSFLAAAIGLSGAIFITYFYVIKHGKATDQFIMETQLFIVCYAGGILGLAARYRHTLERIPEAFKRMMEKLSRLSIGIYFFHCLVIWTVGDISFSTFRLAQSDGALAAVGCCVIYYLLSVVGVSLMARIPVLKRLVT